MKKDNGELHSRLSIIQQRVLHLEQKIKCQNQDEDEFRDKEKFMETEIENLRGKLKAREDEKKEGFVREEKVIKQN